MPIPVEYTESFEYPDVAFTLVTASRLSADRRELLQELLKAWYLVGAFGGYGGDGGFDYMSDVGFVEEDTNAAEWWIDIGSADFQAALEALLNCLDGFEKTGFVSAPGDRPSLMKLILGWRHEADAS